VKPAVLILCTGNSCRSHLAEAVLRAAAGDLVDVHSAGSRPAGYVHPLAVRVLAEIGLDASGHRSKHLNEFLERPIHTVITVCGRADQVCPVFPGRCSGTTGASTIRQRPAARRRKCSPSSAGYGTRSGGFSVPTPPVFVTPVRA
jgi:protein-tyrosine-phosphatase